MDSRIRFAIVLVLAVALAGCGRQASEPKAPPPEEPSPASGAATGPATVTITPLNEAAAKERTATSVERLLQHFPKSMAPKPGPDGIIDRNEANAWLATNVVDKSIEVLLPIADLQIEDGIEGKYNIDLLLTMDADSEVPKEVSKGYTLGTLPLGGIPCRVEVRAGSPTWTDVDSATAKERRKLKGNQVLFRARIVDAGFHEGANDHQLLLAIDLTDFKALHSTPIGVWLDADDTMPRRRAAGIAKDVQWQGTVKMFDAADRLICVENYKDGKKHGKFTNYYPSGGKNIEGNFVDGLFQGKGTRWYEDGKLLGIADTVDGQIHGKSILYYKNGNQAVIAPYVRDKAHGRGDSYTPDGQHMSIMTWEDGKLLNEEFLIRPTPDQQQQIQSVIFTQAQWKAMWENQ